MQLFITIMTVLAIWFAVSLIVCILFGALIRHNRKAEERARNPWSKVSFYDGTSKNEWLDDLEAFEERDLY